ncbi:hypothetical protein QWI28_22480 [Citrobacter freundii]|nr:hypothetical protein [Citrobacter freundii]
MTHQIDVAATTSCNGFHRITGLCQLFINSEIGIKQIAVVREKLPEDWQYRFVAWDHRPQRFEDQHFRAQQHVD